MTVCVAALCEGGRKIVVATDTQLSFAGVAANAPYSKAFWFGDWMFLYAGAPSRIELINEELRKVPQLNRSTICEAVDSAYRKAKSRFCAHSILSQYDLSMQEFKDEGLKMFGEQTFSRLSERVDAQAEYFNEQLLVIGYGDNENAGHIFEFGATLASHALSGIAAIGSGADVALANLLLLKHARHSSLGDGIYSVAAAKFAAEMAHGNDVGSGTMMYVAWKRSEKDEVGRPPGMFFQQEDVESLRRIWEEHGRPKIPNQSAEALWPLVHRLRRLRSESPTVQDVVLRLHVERLEQG